MTNNFLSDSISKVMTRCGRNSLTKLDSNKRASVEFVLNAKKRRRSLSLSQNDVNKIITSEGIPSRIRSVSVTTDLALTSCTTDRKITADKIIDKKVFSGGGSVRVRNKTRDRKYKKKIKGKTIMLMFEDDSDDPDDSVQNQNIDPKIRSFVTDTEIIFVLKPFLIINDQCHLNTWKTGIENIDKLIKKRIIMDHVGLITLMTNSLSERGKKKKRLMCTAYEFKRGFLNICLSKENRRSFSEKDLNYMCSYIDSCNNGYNIWLKKCVPVYSGIDLEKIYLDFIRGKHTKKKYTAKLGFSYHSRYHPKEYISTRNM